MDCMREVWSRNVEDEILHIDHLLYLFPIISFDTEFPGCLRKTPRSASESQRYQDMKFNVTETKLIQLGFTLSDAFGNFGPTWEVNFFGESWDLGNEESLQFLRDNGLDLDRIKTEGVSTFCFFGKFFRMLRNHPNVRWVSFHGTYDIAYIIKFLTGKSFPETPEEFAAEIGKHLGSVYDLKYMAGLGGGECMGLERLAQCFGVVRSGEAHHAGSDSLLTARLFARMIEEHKGIAEVCEGWIYGINTRVTREHTIQTPQPCYGVSPPCYRMPVSVRMPVYAPPPPPPLVVRHLPPVLVSVRMW